MTFRFLPCRHLLKDSGDLLGLQTDARFDMFADRGVLDLGVVGSEGKDD